ncbi:putative short-chain dehydrogenase [Rhizodiscina lignyota]|uniref:Short-chain dehydrogenase n=1 Tax=Rhizodiscina lignyota TaxID=1504668 RepID=A0A9P4M6F5_9PEZI|nr:putative short-chain dehydrogenase [Rhizodiscina lignyota]
MTATSTKPPGRLQDKVAIVTGSSSGLGRAISLLYAQEGAKVVCADIRSTARAEVPGETAVDTHGLIQQAGGDAIFVECNVGIAADVESLVEKAVAHMVNNAGIALEARNPQPVHTTSEETWDLTMSINAKSVFLGCKYAITQMLAQEPHPCGDRGWIINISSIYGLVGGANNPSYCASKGAVSNLTRNISVDYSPHLIHCNAINPGHVQTAIFAETTKHMVSMEAMNQMYPFRGPGRPEDIAKMAVVLASDDASWMTGACVSVDGGYVAR